MDADINDHFLRINAYNSNSFDPKQFVKANIKSYRTLPDCDMTVEQAKEIVDIITQLKENTAPYAITK